MDRRELEKLAAAAARPQLIHVRAFALLHERHPKPRTGTCECCGSDLARISERVELDELIIDIANGQRYRLSEIKDKAGFADLAKRCDVSTELPLRLPAWSDEEGFSPLAALLDHNVRRLVLEGGNRGGKTTEMCCCAAWDWLTLGGPGAEFALLGPEMKQAHLLKRKLFEGETVGRFNPPIFPPELWTSVPEKERQEDQFCRMVDGSRFWCTHAKQAGHLKGRAWSGAYWTEARECKHSEVNTVVRARVVDAGGRVVFDSTPGPDLSHWLKTGVVDIANEEKFKAGRGEQVERTTRILNFSSLRNPWICPEEMAKARADAVRHNPQDARREFDGEWCSDYSTLFGEVWDASYHIEDIPGGNLAAIGLNDITRKASRRFFRGGGHSWVLGCDVNFAPMCWVACRIFGDPEDETTWGLAILDEFHVWHKGPTGAGQDLLKYKDGRYAGAGISIDATAAQGHTMAGRRGGKTGTPALELRSLGFNCLPCNTSPKTGRHSNPDVQDSTNLLKWLMRRHENKPRRFVVHSGCTRMIRAIETQENRGDGRPPKVSNSFTDREVNNVIECARYLGWSLFTESFHRGSRKKIKI